MCCITARPQCLKGFLTVNPFISHIYICQKFPKMYVCVCVFFQRRVILNRAGMEMLLKIDSMQDK